MSTVSIRPTTIYGEEDNYCISEPLRMAKKFGRWSPVDCNDTIHHLTYVGNTAWAFICADKALIKVNDGSSTRVTLATRSAHAVAGRAYFITDDTSLTNMFEIQSVFATACGYPTNVIKIPASAILFVWYVFYWFLWCISLIIKVNFYAGMPGVKMFSKTFTFKSDLARKLLDYNPIYSYESSKERSMHFYTGKYCK